MPTKLSKILWSLVTLFIIVMTVIFFFWVVLIGAAVAIFFAIYRHYFRKKRSNRFKERPQESMFGEVIDIKAEVIDQTTSDKNKYKN